MSDGRLGSAWYWVMAGSARRGVELEGSNGISSAGSVRWQSLRSRTEDHTAPRRWPSHSWRCHAQLEAVGASSSGGWLSMAPQAQVTIGNVREVHCESKCLVSGLKIQRGKRVNSPPQIHQKKIENRENTSIGRRIKLRMYGVLFLRSRC